MRIKMAGGVAHITHRPSGWPRGQLAYPNSTHPLLTDQDPRSIILTIIP